MSNSEKTHFHWTIPIILFVIAQTVSSVWWASHINTSVENLQSQVVEYISESNQANLRQDARIEINNERISDINASIATLNTLIQSVDDNLDRLDTQLDQNNALLRRLLEDRQQ